ncbi:hypothetical protein OC844_003799 [Tilletia horrida]|nr:hypothetical protein OC844_003799 [Tilletia horrida]
MPHHQILIDMGKPRGLRVTAYNTVFTRNNWWLDDTIVTFLFKVFGAYAQAQNGAKHVIVDALAFGGSICGDGDDCWNQAIEAERRSTSTMRRRRPKPSTREAHIAPLRSDGTRGTHWILAVVWGPQFKPSAGLSSAFDAHITPNSWSILWVDTLTSDPLFSQLSTYLSNAVEIVAYLPHLSAPQRQGRGRLASKDLKDDIWTGSRSRKVAQQLLRSPWDEVATLHN